MKHLFVCSKKFQISFSLDFPNQANGKSTCVIASNLSSTYPKEREQFLLLPSWFSRSILILLTCQHHNCELRPVVLLMEDVSIGMVNSATYSHFRGSMVATNTLLDNLFGGGSQSQEHAKQGWIASHHNLTLYPIFRLHWRYQPFRWRLAQCVKMSKIYSG